MEHKMVSIADQIFDELEKAILTGEYERGDILTEIKLSEKMGVSRTPIREALRRLDQERIIEITAKGAKVIGINDRDIADIYDIRLRIEGMASFLAAQRRSEEDMQRLKRILDLQEFYTKKEDADQIKNYDSEFHLALYQISQCPTLLDTLEPLHRKVIKFRKVSVAHPGRALKSFAEHKAIYDAIAEGDAINAEKLTCEHIANARKSILGK